MRDSLKIVAGLGFAIAAAEAAAQEADPPEQPEVIMVRDLFADGGMREVRPNWEEINKHPLGSPGNPVRCEMPRGQRAYLSRLRCPGGDAPQFQRRGSAGFGPFETIIDVYEVKCPASDGMGDRSVFLDMYHPKYVEKRAVPGFTIMPARKSRNENAITAQQER